MSSYTSLVALAVVVVLLFQAWFSQVQLSVSWLLLCQEVMVGVCELPMVGVCELIAVLSRGNSHTPAIGLTEQ